MTGWHQVDLAHIDEMAGRLAGLSGFIAEQLTALETAARNLPAASWSGAARTAFDAAHRDWVAGAREFNTAVDALARDSRAAHGHYQTAHTINLQMLGG